jgi:hypothetical protein
MSALKPLVGIFAAGLLLSACTPTGGTAADVAGQRIPETKVDAAIDGCESVGFPLVDGVNTTRASVAFSLAAGEVVRQGDAFGDARPAREDIEAAVAQSFPGEILTNRECKEFLSGSIGFNVAMQNLQASMSQEEFVDTYVGIIDDIELNPKYGRIKEQADGTPAIQHGSLSVDPEQSAPGQ